jgi:hypothetical protein
MKTLQYERGAEAGAAGGLAFVRIVIDDLVAQLRDVRRDGARHWMIRSCATSW